MSPRVNPGTPGRPGGLGRGWRPGALAAAALAALAALLLAGCGDDTSGDGPALGHDRDRAPAPADPGTGAALTVEAHDIEFDRDAYRIAAGPVAVAYQQKGTLPHSLVIEEADGAAVDGFRLEVGGADTDHGTLDLPPGRYVVYCDVPGHRDAGMEAGLVVDRPRAAASPGTV